MNTHNRRGEPFSSECLLNEFDARIQLATSVIEQLAVTIDGDAGENIERTAWLLGADWAVFEHHLRAALKREDQELAEWTKKEALAE